MKKETKQVIREASAVSAITFVVVIAVAAGSFVFGRKSGTLDGDMSGYERGYKEGAVAQYNLERQNEASVKKPIGFMSEVPQNEPCETEEAYEDDIEYD